MNIKLLQINDYLVDRMGEIHEYKGPCNMIEKRDGYDFNYPGALLNKVSTGETFVIAQSQLDITYMLVHEETCGFGKLDTDKAIDKYVEAFEDAMQKRYVDQGKKDKEYYRTLAAASHMIVENYSQMNMMKEMTLATKELLKNFSTYLLLHVEMTSTRVQKKKDAQASKSEKKDEE